MRWTAVSLAVLLMVIFAMPAVADEPLEVKITSFTNSVYPGDPVSLAARTTQRAECQTTVRYKLVVFSTRTVKANANGDVNWRWLVAKEVVPGTWPVSVSCTLGDRKGLAAAQLTIK